MASRISVRPESMVTAASVKALKRSIHLLMYYFVLIVIIPAYILLLRDVL